MKFDDQDIAAIAALGYTKDESQFLYLVAVHSGYFVPRQFLTFSGAKWGKRSSQFTAKLESRGHVTWREYDRTGGVYHLFTKTLYRRIGKENLRNRRRHSVEFIRTRLVLLDFVLANLDYDYLETEPEKVTFFTETLDVLKKALPAKAYRGNPDSGTTLRYFVDKFPLFVDRADSSVSPVVTFSYVDPGQASLTGFANHLHVYLPLFRQVANFFFAYIANSPVHFIRAEKCFASLVLAPLETDVSSEILRYFHLRNAWALKKYGCLSAVDIEWLKEATHRFHGDHFEHSYHAWASGLLSADALRSEFTQIRRQCRVRFKTYLVAPSPFGKKSSAEGEGNAPHLSTSPESSRRTSPLP